MRSHLGAAAIAVSLLSACGGGSLGPGPSTPPPPTASANADACARAVTAREWTTERSVPSGVVARGDGLELGLSGRAAASVRVTVRAPDGSELAATKFRQGSVGTTTHYVARYPADFLPAGLTGVLGLTIPGTYAATWEVSGAVAACDRFDVSRAGAADAQPCAPAGWTATAQEGSLAVRSGAATMTISGTQVPLGVIADPWYVFQAADRQTLALADGSTTTVYVSVSTTPRRVSTQFKAGGATYGFEASAEGAPDLVDRSRDVVLCAQRRLQTVATGTAVP